MPAPVVDLTRIPREVLSGDVSETGTAFQGHWPPIKGGPGVPVGKSQSLNDLQERQKTMSPTDCPPDFEVLEPGRAYRLHAVRGGSTITLTLSGIRYRKEGLTGWLDVRRPTPDSRQRDNLILSRILIRLDGLRDREAAAEHLGKGKDGKPDVNLPPFWWAERLEDLLWNIRQAERETSGAQWIANVPPANGSLSIEILGAPILLGSRPTIFFGPGGSGKSYLAAAVIGHLSRRGRRIAYLDWEDDPGVLSERTEKLFGRKHGLNILHVPVGPPLAEVQDRVAEQLKVAGINFVVIDSAGPAAGKAEAAEETQTFFAALGQLGVPALILAHVTKNSETATRYPFGSVMWHNRAGSTFYVESPDDDDLVLTHRKSNYGKLRPVVHIARTFEQDRTIFAVRQPEDIKRSVRERLEALIGEGVEPNQRELAEKLSDVPKETVKKTLQRWRKKNAPAKQQQEAA
jgi:hypothetical protein